MDLKNTYVFLVTKETAEKYNLKTVSDLGKIADKLVARCRYCVDHT